MLNVRNLFASYGKIRALNGISFVAGRGQITTLLGSNGAGKTTTMRAITGLIAATGEVTFQDRPVIGLRPDKILRLGISMVPERRELFAEMSVEQNLQLGAYTRSDTGEIRNDLERVVALFPRLRERYRQISGTLSGGEQQMLTIGRALMSRPKLLILDEPSLGLAPNLVTEILETIDRIRKDGITILLVEQNSKMALAISDAGYVIENGEVALSGSATELRANPKVQEAYL
ncbi:ABC transporter ATP-binding protein [Pseudorhodoplanes sp.]|uniref:ABC transporter ATP-binding protein n=1 Tax=Pseudorhodoplanes sp. TaxID=1934341 RepID=UPI003D0D6DC8